MKRVDRHRTNVAATAADVTVGHRLLAGRRGRRLAALQELPLARGKEDDPAVGEIAGVEVVVAAPRQLPPAATVEVHLEQMVERILRQLRLVDLLHGRNMRVVAAVREQHPATIVRNDGTQEAAVRPVARQAADLRLVGPKAAQQPDAAARLRPPTVVLVRHVREHRRRPLDEEDRLEVQQRIGQGHLPHRPTGLEVKLPGLRLGHVGRKTCRQILASSDTSTISRLLRLAQVSQRL